MDLRSSPTSHQPAHHSTEMPAAHVPATSRLSKGDKVFKLQKQMVMWLIIAILFIAAIGTAAFYVKKYHDSQNQVKKLQSNPTVAAQTEAQTLISQIGKLTDLPTGETPTVATVTDITKLKDQPFFASAKNGDKVLIYTTAKKAYLYRPSTNKIINIAPVNLGSGTSSTSGTTTNTTTNSSTAKP